MKRKRDPRKIEEGVLGCWHRRRSHRTGCMGPGPDQLHTIGEPNTGLAHQYCVAKFSYTTSWTHLFNHGGAYGCCIGARVVSLNSPSFVEIICCRVQQPFHIQSLIFQPDLLYDDKV